MTAKNLLELTADDLIRKITNNKGLSIFAAERSKFEGWFKVELIDTLLKNEKKAKPEIDLIDIVFKDTAIELKTINTNYRFDDVKDKHRPITKNINSVLKDISDLEKKELKNKFVVFIVFPLSLDEAKWNQHISKIENKLTELVCEKFKFNKGIPAAIYYGKV